MTPVHPTAATRPEAEPELAKGRTRPARICTSATASAPATSCCRHRAPTRKLASGPSTSPASSHPGSSARKCKTASGMRASVRRNRSGDSCHRWYEPQTGRYSQPDPLGLAGGLHQYLYAESNPVLKVDPSGLAVLVCSRPAFVTRFTPNGVGNHGYFWDDRPGIPDDQRACSRTEIQDYTTIEGGPRADTCVAIPGSPGREDEIMGCCRTTSRVVPFYFPGISDCFTPLEVCIEFYGLPDTPPPGGRLGPRCVECPIEIPWIVPVW